MPADPYSAAGGLLLGLVGGIGGAIQRGKANRQMNTLLGQDPTYSANPIAADRLALARQMLNARMPGSASVERNIYANTANQVGGIQRNATDASQAIAAASGAFAQGDNAFNQLGINEAQDYQRRYSNLVGAQEGEINEGDKVYNDKLRRYSDLVQIRGAQNQNNAANWQSLSNLGGGLMNFGLAGGFSSAFGNNNAGGGGGNNQSANPNVGMNTNWLMSNNPYTRR